MASPNPLTESRWSNFNAVSSKRSFALMAAGAMIGLIMAGYTLFTARGTSTLFVPPDDVALVNQQPISRSDFLQQLQTQFGADLKHSTLAERRKVLDDMIREELFVQRGKELDVASIDPEVRSAMVNSIELEIAADAITSQPNESQLRAYYTSHRARYASEGTMVLHDYLFPSNEANVAAQAAEFLKSSIATPALLAQWHAADSGKVAGEEFYFASKIHLGNALFELARDLPDGGVSPPVPYEDGIHVLYMVRNRRPVPFEFETARIQVLSDFRNDAIARLRNQDEAFLRKRANILIADDLR
jgi:parvulin-like peptidyl-prolyl isomerase